MANIQRVDLAADVYYVCITHAFTTEDEEIMGLLIGELDEDERVVKIKALKMLIRSDKQPDRVEISPEQLVEAQQFAEELSNELQRDLKVVGWYHSHPKITIWPSHVDLRTQAQYQMLSNMFVGIIFSLFDHDKATKQNKIQVTCFQSSNLSPEGEPPIYDRLEIPLYIEPTVGVSPTNLRALALLPEILGEEELEAYRKATDTGDSEKQDLVTSVHNGAVFVKKITRLLEVTGGPLLQLMEQREQHNQHLLKQLKAEEKQLTEKLQRLDKEKQMLQKS